MLVLCIWAFFITTVVCGVLVMRARRHARKYPNAAPQRFHAGDVPRVGGVALAAGMGSAVLLGLYSTLRGDYANLNMGWWAVVWGACMIPAVAGGLLEDLTQRAGVRWRFALTCMSAALAVWLLGASMPRLDIAWLDACLQAWPWIGMAIALLAITGLPHALNIIDGYNGLACMVSIIVSLALAHVSLQLGDRSLAAVFMVTAASSGGLLLWNYPRGLIFAGDGGAYLWGSILSIGSILLVQRHEEVSPWFPLLLLIYPVWETVFSMYRKWARGDSPSMADALHLHQLIYRRIVQRVFDDDNEARDMLMRNNRTSPYLWGYTVMTVLPALVFWRNTWALIGFCIFFMVIYTCAYVAIVRFKVPGWLRW